MARGKSGSESRGGGSRIKRKTSAKGRVSNMAGQWKPSMGTPF